MKEIIQLEKVGKLYRLGQIGTGTLSRDLNRWWARARGQEDPYSKIGQLNDRTRVASGDELVWALKDVSFGVAAGDVLGIIGRNGAGKSTLLKIISRITSPTEGTIRIRGRVASLLEVGTGFHPEMTGRENVFMNGTLLGMTRAEIQKKLDEIVEFAGVALYIDTPVKRYSSGMQLRLAFAVAAFLEPEILIVDEVLAVGDAEFQKKALGRMEQVSKGDGRTVLFVSHNMQAIQRLCSKCVMLREGHVTGIGATQYIVGEYVSAGTGPSSIWKTNGDASGLPVTVNKLIFVNQAGMPSSTFLLGEYLRVLVEFRVYETVRHFIVAIGLKTNNDIVIRTVFSKAQDLSTGAYQAHFEFDDVVLATGTYIITLGTSTFERAIQYFDNIGTFVISEISSSDIDQRIIRNSGVGILLNPINVVINKKGD